MARFKYNGETARINIAYGATSQIQIPRKNGTTQVVDGPPGGFVIGQDIGVDVTDEKSLRVMRADPRFTEI